MFTVTIHYPSIDRSPLVHPSNLLIMFLYYDKLHRTGLKYFLLWKFQQLLLNSKNGKLSLEQSLQTFPFNVFEAGRATEVTRINLISK